MTLHCAVWARISREFKSGVDVVVKKKDVKNNPAQHNGAHGAAASAKKPAKKSGVLGGEKSAVSAGRAMGESHQPTAAAGKPTKKSGIFGSRKSKSAKKPTVGAAAKNPQAAEKSPPKPTPADKAVQREIAGEQRRAYNRAVKKRTAGKKRRGRRGGNYVLYYAFAAVAAIIVFIILANVVLFNCNSIVVEGIRKYTAEEIIGASGIKSGDSLLRIDESAAERRIANAFSFVDAVEVTKQYPTKIVITVTEAERWYAVQYGGDTYTVSRLGKIIERENADKLPLVIGYEAAEPVVGGALASTVEGKNNLPAQVLSAAEKAGVSGITSIDITDRFEIKAVVDGRITLQLGIATELENKMYIAKALIDDEIAATEQVTVYLTNTETVYVRDNNMIDNPVQTAPVLPEETTEPEETAEA